LPADVEARAQRLWLDTASCAWAGLRADEMAAWARIQAASDAGTVGLPGHTARLSGSAAACTFAMAACWDEACEGLARAHGRPGVPIVAALWTFVDRMHPTWQRLWQATAVGYEVAARLGERLRIHPGMHVDGVWGAFGAAVAVVHLQGGTWDQAMAALEACAVQLPYSLYRPVREGANIRNLYLGHSAWLGLQAAQAVAAGFTTPHGAIDDFASLALREPGSWTEPGTWLFLDSYWKPFAAVRHVHYGVQAAQAVRRTLNTGTDTAADHPIDALTLRVYAEAAHYCPNRSPQTVLAAQFSLSFGVAAMLRFGDLSPAEFRAPCFHDPELRRLEQLLDVQVDAARYPAGERGAHLSARFGGQWHEVAQGAVVGDPSSPPNGEAIQAKYSRFTQQDPAMAAWALQVRESHAHSPASLPT
jgi:2-methylcitrate dehydratase PrpD